MVFFGPVLVEISQRNPAARSSCVGRTAACVGNQIWPTWVAARKEPNFVIWLLGVLHELL